VNTLAECKDYVDYLEAVPAFSMCTRTVLQEFVSYGVVKVRCSAGKTLSPSVDDDQNLYVLVSGSALLDAGDVIVSLAPGDHFGKIPGRMHKLVASVVATTDIEVLVVNPLEIARLERASSHERHPSKIEWRSELPTTTRRATRKSYRRAVLVGQG